MAKAREGYRFGTVEELTEGMDVNFGFYINLKIKKIDHENKMIVLEDVKGNTQNQSFAMAKKYLEIKI